VNAAALAALALAPPAPVVTDAGNRAQIGRQPSGYDATLRWTRSPGASAYRVYWREAWAPDWQQSRLIGDATEITLPGMNIDDFVFGVSAVGALGHESLVSAYVQTRTRRPEVKRLK
jgi:hypothetical protein